MLIRERATTWKLHYSLVITVGSVEAKDEEIHYERHP